jgi:hypothetical protein
VDLKPEGPKQGRLAGRYVEYGNGRGLTVKNLYCMKEEQCVYLYIVQVYLETMAKTELSNQWERLQSTVVKELGSKITADRETLLLEKTRLEAELLGPQLVPQMIVSKSS